MSYVSPPCVSLPCCPPQAVTRIVWLGFVLAGFWGLFSADVFAGEPKLDLLIKNGRIVDGSGTPWYVADIGIRAGKIVRIGHIDAADSERTIDATGQWIAPGFIDMMGQSATPMYEDPQSALNLLTQGITTINAGEGASAAPLGAEAGARQGWTTFAEYFALLDSLGLPVNVVQSVGHTQVRELVLGEVDRRPSDEELHKMRELVREGMQAGAIGVSTALIYPPAVYARTEEIASLCEVAGEYGGRYYTHMRNEGDRLLEAIDEALDIGRTGKTPVHIFHLKTAGKQNWHKMPLAIAKIKAARAQGQQVTADIYPYINNGLGIAAFIHPRHFADGTERLLKQLDAPEKRAEIRTEMETTEGWENWYRHVGFDWGRVVVGKTNDSQYDALLGKTVAEVAATLKQDVWDTFFKLVKAGAFVLPQSMSEANKILAMQQDFVSFCTDVGPAGGDSFASHPRAYGAFPRLLSRYVRELGAISLERAVAQASAAAANNVLVYDRGRIAEGLAADIIVFDYEKTRDTATFEKPAGLSEGMKLVIVNGRVVLEDGKYTGARPGRVLRGPGYDQRLAPQNVSTGTVVPELSSFDRMMHDFLSEHKVPGAAVAVTDHGRLVFARGYGYADLKEKQHVAPNSLFRIASISKPITAIAILQLVDQGKLSLDAKVFDVLDFNSDIAAAGDKFEKRLRDVTIEHLLQHRGGWDRDVSFDAMFQSVKFARELNVPAPAKPEDIIRRMLIQPLDFNPGERYAYSNFGYCLLGRVIEKLTGQTYEHYVQTSTLQPLGIKDMRIGATRLEGRAAQEVRYYQPGYGKSVFEADLGTRSPWPYGAWYLEAMDSHGGWLASAVDLAKIAVALEDSSKLRLLSTKTWHLMHARPDGLAGFDAEGKPKDSYYTLGWFNRDVGNGEMNHWHTGSLDGTATILIRRHDGRNFVALLNSRASPSAEHLGRAIDKLLHSAANAVETWPATDQFEQYLKP
ncbi:MAG: serine hydrolase [Pirellulaceae bacterium]|nr:serine hydrolase [Pirellulaceae bacterium]